MKKKKAVKLGKTITIMQAGRSSTLPLAAVLQLIDKAFSDKRYDNAIQLARQLLSQHPGTDRARLVLYRSLVATEQFFELDNLCSDHLASKPRDVMSLEYRAHALRHLGRDSEALPLLEKAVAIAGPDARLINALGTAYKEAGRAGSALQCFQRATAIKPLFGMAYWNRSDLDTDRYSEIQTLETKLERLPKDSKELPYFYFSLYRAYEAVGELDKAFENLQKGNASKKATLGYQVDNEVANDDRIRQFFKTNYQEFRTQIAQSGVEFPNFSPIFIVGMPRSGTSLVEQILAAHSQVSGGGELPLLTRATEMLLRRLNSSETFPQCLSQFAVSDFAQLGLTYRDLAVTHLGKLPRLTDKFLLNYKVAPLIKLVLPEAKIVHVRRDPMDTCFGCFRQLFTTGLGFSYDWDDLVQSYASYQTTMTSWQEMMGDELYNLSYEELIDNIEPTAQHLLAYCELPWEDQCLNFHTIERPVKTVSSLQVREPVFKSGVGRWKCYQKQLEPFRQRLLSAIHGT